MDIAAARRKLDQRRIIMDQLRGKSLTVADQLANLQWAMEHCDRCDGKIAFDAEVCPHCQYQLM